MKGKVEPFMCKTREEVKEIENRKCGRGGENFKGERKMCRAAKNEEAARGGPESPRNSLSFEAEGTSGERGGRLPMLGRSPAAV